MSQQPQQEGQTGEAFILTAIDKAKGRLKGVFADTKDIVQELGHEFEKVFTNPKDRSHICDEIKNAFKEEITAGQISARTIEVHCLAEWKDQKKSDSGRQGGQKVQEDKNKLIATIVGGGKQTTMTDFPSEVAFLRHREKKLNDYAYKVTLQLTKTKDKVKELEFEKEELEREKQYTLDGFSTLIKVARNEARNCKCKTCVKARQVAEAQARKRR